MPGTMLTGTRYWQTMRRRGGCVVTTQTSSHGRTSRVSKEQYVDVGGQTLDSGTTQSLKGTG